MSNPDWTQEKMLEYFKTLKPMPTMPFYPDTTEEEEPIEWTGPSLPAVIPIEPGITNAKDIQDALKQIMEGNKQKPKKPKKPKTKLHLRRRRSIASLVVIDGKTYLEVDGMVVKNVTINASCSIPKLGDGMHADITIDIPF